METSKEVFDRTMNEVQAQSSKGLPKDSEMSEVEKEVKEDVLKEKTEKFHLSKEEKSVLTEILKTHSENKILDPVLLQLLKMRELAKKDYLEKQNAIKAIYLGVMKDLNELSQEALKLQGVIESTDKQILEVFKERENGVSS